MIYNKNLWKFLNLAGIFMIVGFAIRLGADYYKSQRVSNTASFSGFILERCLEFLVPGIICFAAAVFFKSKSIKNK